MDELKANVTEALSSLISKPALKDKLLSKPPFRFLHSIISYVSKIKSYVSTHVDLEK